MRNKNRYDYYREVRFEKEFENRLERVMKEFSGRAKSKSVTIEDIERWIAEDKAKKKLKNRVRRIWQKLVEKIRKE